MELIDKAAVVAEIESYISHYKDIVAKIDRNDSTWADSVSMIDARIDVLQHLLSFLDTLEVKEVDLAQEIKNGIDNLSNLYCYMEDLFNGNEEEGVYPIPENVKNELFEFAKHFFELGLKVKKGE